MAVTAEMDMYSLLQCRLPGRLREQARSHSWVVGCQGEKYRLVGRHRRQASSHISPPTLALFQPQSTHGFEESGGAHPTPHAHGDNPVTQVAPLQFAHQVPHLPRAGHAERVPDGD